MTKIFRAGDKSKAVCSTCKSIVSTTMAYNSYTIPGTKIVVPNLLLGYCDDCHALVSLPHQNAAIIKKFIDDKKIKIDESTLDFIKNKKLVKSVRWLQKNMPKYFKNLRYEITVLNNELLGLKVYTINKENRTQQFANIRHRLCNDIKKAGHKNLYDVISIFQRTEQNKTEQDSKSMDVKCPIGLHEIKVNVKPRGKAKADDFHDAVVWYSAVKDTYLYMCKRMNQIPYC